MGEAAITITFAQGRDAQPIAQMSRDLIETGLGWKYRAETVLRALSDPDTMTLAARRAGALVGFAMAHFGDERMHLVLLAVLAQHRRGGVARRLLQWLLDSAAVAGVAEVDLELRAANADALGFYRSMGFAEFARVDGYYGGSEAAIRMRRSLRDRHCAVMSWQAPSMRKT
ncbi:MAG: GNAT family N-acetyltransferase [Rubrivivax sp.]